MPARLLPLFLLAFCSLLPCLFMLGHTGNSVVLKIYVTSITMLLLCALLWRHRLTQPLSLLLCALLAINFGLSLFSYSLYQAPFNDGFALSILETHPDESFEMLAMYWPYLAVTTVSAIGLMLLTRKLSRRLPTRVLQAGSLLLAAFMSVTYAKAAYHDDSSQPRRWVPSAYLMEKSALFNASYFIAALNDSQLIGEISQRKVRHHIEQRPTGIDTYVVVIGESARRQSMNLYGYPQPDTPQANAQRQNMLLFNDAIAAAPITVLAVPLSLSIASPDRFELHDYADNIIGLAGEAGYRTYWLSAQDAYGNYSNAVTAIALNAREKAWVSGDHDFSLLPHLDKTLQQPGRKVIFLHLMGSHSSACERFPSGAAVLHEQGSYDSCYVNSIRYTDSLLGQVFARLKGLRASVLYYSDHGQERTPDNGGTYYHGGEYPSQEAYRVPQFIWYSDAVPRDRTRTGQVNAPYSTADNYYLMMNWLGIRTGVRDCTSPLSDCYAPPSSITVLNAARRKLDYHRLPDNVRLARAAR
ncbi:phosphoethanolamine transferase [Microvirgula aerodenitrificans]|uniref:phosphoethanolamine transferase n=1 Tax=Microvirgula aerodenitrificans TaxID=57480 RepID=UPI0028E99D04|nr:phosphoethanolamine transferase [Microvirgula aerodenitrificans]